VLVDVDAVVDEDDVVDVDAESGDGDDKGAVKMSGGRTRQQSTLYSSKRKRPKKRRRTRPSIWDDDEDAAGGAEPAEDAAGVVVDMEEDRGDIVPVGNEDDLILTRRDNAVPRWLDTAVGAWIGVSETQPGRDMFLLSELQEHAHKNWEKLCWPHAYHKRWNSMMRRVVCDGQGKHRPFTAVTRPNGQREVRLRHSFGEVQALLCFIPRSGQQNVRPRPHFPLGEASPSKARVKKRAARDTWGESYDDKDLSEFLESAGEGTEPEVDQNVDDAAKGAGGVSRVQPSSGVDPKWWQKPEGPVALSSFDIAPGLTFVESETTPQQCIRGHKGFRSVRATYGVVEGSWYYEVTVLPYSGDGAVRLGWATRCADIGTPVGSTGSGFGIRDRTGEFVYDSLPVPYGESFGVGDVIGVRITLPSSLSPQRKRSIAERDIHWLNYRFVGWTPPAQGMRSQDFEGASVQFYKNGKAFGVPTKFSKNDPSRVRVPDGTYFPTISLFKNAEVSVNFGPFATMPASCRPMSDLDTKVETADAGSGANAGAVDSNLS
jgi:hypothetical protein